MKRLTLVCVSVLFAALTIFGQPIRAQEAPPPRDPAALAADYRGYDGAVIVPPLAETYAVGDSSSFWVAKTTSPTPVQITATLAAVALDSYVWLEDGIDAGEAALGTVAEQVGGLWSAIRVRTNYVPRAPLPIEGDASSFIDPNDLLPVPDVDGDPRLHIVYARDLRADFGLNPIDSLPAAIALSPASNAREVLYVNITPFVGVELGDGLYVIGMIRALYAFTMTYNVPTQAPWLTETLGGSIIAQLQDTALAAGDIDAYFAAPETTTFLQPSTFANRGAVNAAQQMFLGYLAQQYGTETFRRLFLSSGGGLTPIEATLMEGGFSDLVTGLPVTARDLFADFLIANLVNSPIGDGRYVHRATPLEQGQFPRLIRTESLPYAAEDASVAQFGASYTLYGAEGAPQAVTVTFAGESDGARFSMGDHAADDAFYWSGGAADARATLTRAFDLTGVDAAALTFSAWYDLSDGWNYAYVSVSDDGGATWAILPAAYTGETANTAGIAARDPHGVAYGAGFTGMSNPAGAQPFPIVGVVILNDGVTLGEVSPGGPADTAGIRAGDLVIGYDGAEWESVPDIIGLLSRYNPGDTLNLYIQRGNERLDVPIVLGAHPTRIRQPEPLWLPYRVDLTAYAGRTILLRFDTVSLPGRADGGIAIDDLAIDTLEYSDSAPSDSDWTMDGWSRTFNARQQAWLVQAVTTGTADTPPRVRRLLDWNADEPAGSWTIPLAANEGMIVVVAAVNDDTTLMGRYTLLLSAADD
jgi:membrane-associated protease RseP (regulator of RpoE activity)